MSRNINNLSCLDCIHFDVCAPDRITPERCENFHPYCEGCEHASGIDSAKCALTGERHALNYYCREGVAKICKSK